MCESICVCLCVCVFFATTVWWDKNKYKTCAGCVGDWREDFSHRESKKCNIWPLRRCGLKTRRRRSSKFDVVRSTQLRESGDTNHPENNSAMNCRIAEIRSVGSMRVRGSCAVVEIYWPWNLQCRTVSNFLTFKLL